jgi:hypothetical protein
MTNNFTFLHLVGTLRCWPEGRWFNSRWCHWNLLFTIPGVDSASNINEYQEYFLRGGLRRPVRKADNLTTFMCRSCGILEAPGPVQVCTGIALYVVRICDTNVTPLCTTGQCIQELNWYRTQSREPRHEMTQNLTGAEPSVHAWKPWERPCKPPRPSAQSPFRSTQSGVRYELLSHRPACLTSLIICPVRKGES